MIEVTKINDIKITLNSDLIELIEEIPDTMITLTNGKKIIVKENRQEVRDLIIAYRKDIFSNLLK